MIQTELTVQNQLGLHARVASYIVRQAKTFLSDIYIKRHRRDHRERKISGHTLCRI